MDGVDAKLAAVKTAKRAIMAAETVDDLRGPLLTLASLLEIDAEQEVRQADLILGIRRPSEIPRS